LGAVIESFAMISPEDRSVSPRQGFRYSQRSIIVNRDGKLVVSKKIGEKQFYANFLDSQGQFIVGATDEFYNQQQFGSHSVDKGGNLLLDEWFEDKDLPSNFFGGQPYGGNYKTAQEDYNSMRNDLREASENEDKINGLRAVSNNEFQSWKKDLNSEHYFRDMKITEKIFGVRKEKAEAPKNISNAFLMPLNDAFDHEINELNVSLQNTKKALNSTEESLKKSKKQLKKSPNNKSLINKTIQQLIDKKKFVNQEKLVKSEIKSFQNLNNRDSFYRSSMKRSDFNVFQQCRTRE